MPISLTVLKGELLATPEWLERYKDTIKTYSRYSPERTQTLPKSSALTLNLDEFTIGSDASSTLVIPDKDAVAGKHVTIRHKKKFFFLDGGWEIEFHASTYMNPNGNLTLHTAGQKQQLQEGDQIKLSQNHTLQVSFKHFL